MDVEGLRSKDKPQSSDVFSLDDQRNSRNLNRRTRVKRQALTDNWKSSTDGIDLEVTYRDVFVRSPELKQKGRDDG